MSRQAFQTQRLGIQEIAVADLGDIHALHSLPETDRYNTLGIPESLQTTERIVGEWLAGQDAIPQTYFVFRIAPLDTGAFVGLIALQLGKPNYRTGEVWYKLLPDHWGKGYATEALIGLLSFGFHHLRLHRMEAGCAVENTASDRVLVKAGMTREGMKRKNLPIQGAWKDNYFFGILAEEFGGDLKG